MHPLTRLIWNKYRTHNFCQDDFNKIITDYLRERVEWLKKQSETGNPHRLNNYEIDQAFELDEEKTTFPDKTFKPSIGGCNVAKSQSEKTVTFTKKLNDLHMKLHNQFPSADDFWEEFIYRADRIAKDHFSKPTEPQSKLPEKLEWGHGSHGFTSDEVAQTINELIDYLKEKEE